MSDDQSRAELDRALTLVRFLRARCPWDARQTPRSLTPYLLEEAHEVAEAVGRLDDPALATELGDLLLNVAFQIVLAEERAAFTAADVVRQLEEKMRRRHPQLYDDGPAGEWESLKAKERAAASPDSSVLDGVAAGLDPLSRAQRVQDRAAGIGFDWSEAEGALRKVIEESEELTAMIRDGSPARIEEELGDLLFSIVNVARLTGTHAMLALQQANAKFERRFRGLERLARERGVDLAGASLAAMDELWEEIKRTERSPRTGS
ncbi:MAG: nucleoside triphosphate pyrophosphohydrolase [Gemmatimonadetes bacterium]|nr:nucleoside triphosphate pyrophosphohydrolase [Gemmatimonadota bacterium]